MRILIVRNDSNSQALDASLLLAAYFTSQSIEFDLIDSTTLAFRGESEQTRSVLEAGVDLVVALGGDGTILRTARYVGSAGIPILGINFGRLGFLANTSDEGVVALVAAALAGEVVAEQRTNLHIDVVCEGEKDPYCENSLGEECADTISLLDSHVSEEQHASALRSFFAFNEVVVTRGALGRIIDFSLGISGSLIAAMRGDGIVVATATGSTAYSLSAGGPLVAPGFGGLIVTPLAPHTLRSRSLVAAENDIVDIDLTGNAADREATVFIDGEILTFDRPLAHIYVRRGAVATTLLRYQHEDFYSHVAKVFF